MTPVGRTFSRLNVKITMMFMVVIIALISLSSGTLYVEFNKIYRKQIMSDVNQIMLQNKINIDRMISSINQATMLLYADPMIMDTLNNPSSDYIANYNAIEKVEAQLIKYIYVPLSSSLTSYEISFFVNDKVPFANYLPETEYTFSGLYNDRKVSGQPWYKEAFRRDGQLYWFQDEQNKNRLYVARLIKNVQAGANSQVDPLSPDLGIVVINFDITQIKNQIEGSKLTPSTQIVLLDEQGHILYNPDFPLGKSMLDYVSKQPIDKFDNGTMETITANKKDYFYNLNGMSNGWKLVAFIPNSDITKRMAVVKDIIWTTTVLALIAGAALSVFLSNRISRPIRKLALTMGKVQNTQNIQISVTPSRNDEVGILYSNFNKMMERIHDLMEDVYTSGVKEKEAELKALQAQINPHFLYNTLDSVNWIALGIGADQIATMTSSLANILRYSLKEPNRLVPISEELEQVRNYIDIQMLCYDNVFDVEYDLEPDLLECNMPKLILQPLVENAIQHGIEMQSERGRITIRGFSREDTILLTVDNTGDGSADFAEINAYLAGKNAREKDSGGYGIKNVDQRIQLMFGNGFGLRFAANSSGGVTAVVTLPRK